MTYWQRNWADSGGTKRPFVSIKQSRPFPKFIVNVDSVHLSQLQYASDDALIAALKQAPVQSLEWTFAKH